MSSVHILGMGAVGLLFAHRLAQHQTVTLITRTPAVDNFHIIEHDQTTQLAVASTTLNTLNSKITDCLIPVKAYQLRQAIKDIAPYLSDDANLIISHNGMSDITEITPHLKPHQGLFFLTTSMGGMKPKNDTVRYTGAGLTQLGACNSVAKERQKKVFDTLFKPCITPLEWVPNISEVRWQKLCVNIAINPLSALLQCKNGELRSPKYSHQILALLNEACHIARLEGVNLTLSLELARAYNVMTLTANNHSSMAQDIKHQRQTEIDAICGFIVRQAKKQGVKAPENERIWQLVKQKERA
ncbi:ketopantoate reductase family protein [Pseudoalteromonas sp. SMS1]|uniref:ketopantoate reductase family protein n=1 Tax=Pseudoalteromonas sp. SMS1 TaxID=2908894 RepID=UPI001F3A6369|nr:ketopantoate reductase family protein [Pseudoalteromonas sp. SMS1]MCF2857363.1 ketopantoate reductase family protein [Pseudoalteromonas sp. SMS1]